MIKYRIAGLPKWSWADIIRGSIISSLRKAGINADVNVFRQNCNKERTLRPTNGKAIISIIRSTIPEEKIPDTIRSIKFSGRELKVIRINKETM